MADRFWRGGTAAWDGTAGTKWAATVGGAGGAAVPTAADDVFFDATSTGTCTISTGNTGAKSINCTGFTGTIAGTAAITVSGSVTLVAGMTYTYTGTLTINAASTLTSDGKTHGSITFNASGATLTLGDACTLGATNTFTLTAGTIALNTFTLSTGIFSSSNSNTRAITFGSANIALISTTGATTVLSMATATNFTMTTSGGGFTRNQAASATVNFGATAGGTTSNAPNLTVNAGASALTITSNSFLKNLNFTGSTSTITANGLNVCGDLTLATGGTYTALVTTFRSTSTFTTNGKTVGAVTVNGAGITVTLNGTLTTPNTVDVLTITQGTFDTANNNINTGLLSSTGTLVRAINLGSSTVTLASGINTITLTGSNLTFNAGTSTITINASTSGISSNGYTFYDVSFTSLVKQSTSTITGANTFRNLSFSLPSTTGMVQIEIGADQTITGTLTLSAGTNATMRTFVRSDTIGTTRTLTCAAVSMTDVDFRDITIAGAAAPASGTRIGDCKGNSGITFTAATTRYWNLAGNNNWSATGWAASSGASPAANNFPLAQDTCVFEATSPGTGSTITTDSNWNIGTVDMQDRTSNTMTLTVGTNAVTTPTIYGNWINGTGTTIQGTNSLTFAGRGSQTIRSEGKTWPQQLVINSPSGTVTLQDALVASRSVSNTISVQQGTFDAANYNITLSGAASEFSTSSGSSKTFVLGSGTLTIAGSGFSAGAGPVTYTGTGTISLTSASAKTFSGANNSFDNITINQGGAGTLTITGSNSFGNITNSYAATGATSILFTAGTTTTFGNWSANGTSGKLLTIGSVTAASHTLSKASGTVSADYLSISRSTATGGASWYAGANSTNGGNNSGWIFTAPPGTATNNFFFMFYP